MKNHVITLDTGTTNTRVVLWDHERHVLAAAKAPVGVRNTAIDGSTDTLKAAVKGCIEKVLSEGGVTYDDIQIIIASGMITSNVGLVEIPHCVAPVGADELAEAVREVSIPDVCPIPITFIPGIKNAVDPVDFDNYEAMDMMRGEEVESVAVIENSPRGKSYLIVLPGSHMKFVSANEEGKVTGSLTSISGELLSSITRDTIIADAVERKFVSDETYDRDMVILGYENAGKVGIGRACFSGRILNTFTEKDKTKIANYILGVVLQSDIQAIMNSSAISVKTDTEVIVAGDGSLSQAMIDILQHDGYFSNVRRFELEGDMSMSALGAYIIAGKKHLV